MKKIWKKLLVVGAIIVGVTATMIPNVVQARMDPEDAAAERAAAGSGGSSFSGRTGDNCSSGFLGFVSWDCNVNISDQASLKNGVWQIAANVATDIAVAATYLMIGYTIYGGYLYIFSGGDPGKTAAGKQTLTRAFIGMGITTSANLIMGTIRFALLGAGGQLTGRTDPGGLITGLINWVIGVSGVMSAIFVVYGGIMYMTSNGDPNRTQKAKNMIMYALIGLAIVALSSVISGFVANMIRGAQ